MDEHGLPPGVVWSNDLEHALRQTRVLIPVFTPAYFQQAWCLCEFDSKLAQARRLGLKCVVPVRFSDGEHFPPGARELQWIDFAEFTHLRTVSRARSSKRFRSTVDLLAQGIAALCGQPLPDDPGWTLLVPQDLRPPAFPVPGHWSPP